MKTILILAAGSISLTLGLMGLLLPFMPGFLFLLIAAACFASLSPRTRAGLERHPRLQRFFGRLDAAAHLGVSARAKLAFWAALETIAPSRRN